MGVPWDFPYVVLCVLIILRIRPHVHMHSAGPSPTALRWGLPSGGRDATARERTEYYPDKNVTLFSNATTAH